MTPDYFFIASAGRLQKVDISSIVYIQSANSGVELVTSRHRFACALSIDDAEKILPRELFCRVQEDCIIAIDKMTSFTDDTIQLPGTVVSLQPKFTEQLKSRIVIIDGKNKLGSNSVLRVGRDGKLFGNGNAR